MLKKILLMVTALLIWNGLYAEDFILFKDGRPAASFVCPKDALSNVTGFFNTAVRRCTGQEFPASEQQNGLSANEVRIRMVKRPMADDDEFTITFPDSKTMQLTVTSQSLPAALTFILEKYFGCRFLFPATGGIFSNEENSFCPPVRNVTIPIRTIRKTASFNIRREIDYRNLLWQQIYWTHKRTALCEHMIAYYAFPVYKYAADQSWPREILPTLKGKKFIPPKAKTPISRNRYRAVENYSHGWNPCFSHPKSAEIAIANILEYLKKNPEADSISVGINDNGGMCECAACRKAVPGKNNQVGKPNYSSIYWKWVDRVTRAVAAKYPNVLVTALAYREVIDPPDFKLHKNVLPMICFEITAMNDPAVEARRMQLLNSWGKTAYQLSIWDYAYGMKNFAFPRIYFKSHSKWLEKLYRLNVRGIFAECYNLLPFEGPKHYLMTKKCYDISTDPEKTVMDWCIAAVGAKSAPYLRQYYQFWEDYWNGPDIQKTGWYASKFGTYMALGELPTHTFALKKGDMKKLRALMKKVVANAQTGEQKVRANILFQLFELSEDTAAALFSELIPPDGKIRTAAEAAELLRQVPGAVRAHKKLEKNRFAKLFPVKDRIARAQYSNISMAVPFLKDPEVKKLASQLAASPEMPTMLRSLIKIWLGQQPKNLIVNGSFENPSPLPKVLWNEGGAYRSAKKASDGDYSFRVPQSCCYAYEIPAVPGKTYLFMFDAFLKKESIEGVLNFQLSPQRGRSPRTHYSYTGNKLPPGQWTTFTGICNAIKDTNNIQCMIYLRKFEKDDEIYIDNVRLYCLDDLK